MDVTENTTISDQRPLPGDFLPDDLAGAFNAAFLDEETCCCWILNTIYAGQDTSCPQSSALLTAKELRRFWSAERIRCHYRDKFFTALTDTFLQGCHLTFRQITLLAVFLHFDVNHGEIANKVGVSEETVRLWQKKFAAREKLRIIEGEDGSAEI